MGCVDGQISRNSDLYYRGASVSRQEVHTVLPEKRVCNVMVKLGPVRQVVIEAFGQTGTREREMHLALAMAGGAALPMSLNHGVNPIPHLGPPWMR